MSTKDEIRAALPTRFKTKVHEIKKGTTVTFYERSRPVRDALDGRLFKKGPDGKFLEQKVGDKTFNVPVEGRHFNEEWISTAMEPVFTVEELLDACWPESLKDELCREARKINGETVQDAAGN